VACGECQDEDNESVTGDNMTADEAAIHDIVKSIETSWNNGDGGGFAAPFAEDANFIHIFGGQLDGRRAIEMSHRHIFDTIYKGSRADFRVLSIRFVREDVAIVFTQAHLGFTVAGAKRDVDARPTLTMARQQGQWEIVAFQNTRISEMPADSQAASRLAGKT